jgi:hypothetical protein
MIVSLLYSCIKQPLHLICSPFELAFLTQKWWLGVYHIYRWSYCKLHVRGDMSLLMFTQAKYNETRYFIGRFCNLKQRLFWLKLIEVC